MVSPVLEQAQAVTHAAGLDGLQARVVTHAAGPDGPPGETADGAKEQRATPPLFPEPAAIRSGAPAVTRAAELHEPQAQAVILVLSYATLSGAQVLTRRVSPQPVWIQFAAATRSLEASPIAIRSAVVLSCEAEAAKAWCVILLKAGMVFSVRLEMAPYEIRFESWECGIPWVVFDVFHLVLATRFAMRMNEAPERFSLRLRTG
ncbi:MAG TPA: hypothetical protein VGI45_10685 [Terracidiphilus sp.]